MDVVNALLDAEFFYEVFVAKRVALHEALAAVLRRLYDRAPAHYDTYAPFFASLMYDIVDVQDLDFFLSLDAPDAHSPFMYLVSLAAARPHTRFHMDPALVSAVSYGRLVHVLSRADSHTRAFLEHVQKQHVNSIGNSSIAAIRV